jgi:hypothetical protein
VATYDGLYPLRLSQACDICDRSLEVIVKEGLRLNFRKDCWTLLSLFSKYCRSENVFPFALA